METGSTHFSGPSLVLSMLVVISVTNSPVFFFLIVVVFLRVTWCKSLLERAKAKGGSVFLKHEWKRSYL